MKYQTFVWEDFFSQVEGRLYFDFDFMMFINMKQAQANSNHEEKTINKMNINNITSNKVIPLYGHSSTWYQLRGEYVLYIPCPLDELYMWLLKNNILHPHKYKHVLAKTL